MSLASTISIALSGLRANGRQTQIVSTNLANALTDGFGRQSVELGALTNAGRGGVAVRAISRASAPELTAARRQADGHAADGQARADALRRLAFALGEATGEDGLFRRLEAFETTLRHLAEAPESAPRQVQTVEAARDLVRFLNGLSGEIATVRQNADATIASQVATVNRNIAEIARINSELQRLAASDTAVPMLIDARERLIDEVNALIPVRVQMRPHNVVHLYTTQGQFLLQETASPLGFSPTPVITAPMVYDPVGGGALSGLTLRGVDIAPMSGSPQSIASGALAGQFAVRDAVAVDLQARVDRFAADLIARFQDATVDPTLAPTDPGLFTDNGGQLDPLAIEGLASRIGLNALVDPGLGGDPARLRDGLMSVAPGPVSSDVVPRNLLDALTARRPAAAIPGLAGSLGAAEMVSAIVEITGIARTDADAAAARLSGTRQTLADTEADRLGVDTDTELQTLIQLEQAYAANAQVIQAASRMLQNLLELR